MSLNPDYGTGCYRRRVRVQHLDKGNVLAEMEDDQHGFRIRLSHDGQTITAIHSEALRIPMTTCGNASDVLAQLAGSPLSDSPRSLGAYANPRAHCTHQYDLLGLAVTQARRATPLRQYDVAVHDEHEGIQRITGEIDGVRVFDWQLRGHTIATDGLWKGVSIQKGFAQWAEQNLPQEQLELALIVQRGMLVSTTRRVLIPPMEGMGLLDDPMTKGVCYSYNEPAIQHAIRYGHNHRDFSNMPEQLLRFV
jgi:hypothetical protein